MDNRRKGANGQTEKKRERERNFFNQSSKTKRKTKNTYHCYFVSVIYLENVHLI